MQVYECIPIIYHSVDICQPECYIGIINLQSEVPVTAAKTLTIKITKRRDTILKAVLYSVCIILTFLSLYPIFLYFKDSYQYTFIDDPTPFGKLVNHPYKKLSSNWKVFWNTYQYLFLGLKNSLIVSVSATILTVYFSALTAYSLTAYKWKLRNICNTIIMAAMMIPSTIATYGFLQFIFKMHFTNKLFIFILPAIASPMTVFFMKMYLQASFSKEMIQAARIDGAGEFRIFNQIVLPMLKPAAATQAIFAFAASWNDTSLSFITIAKLEKKTLPLMFSPIYYLDPNDFPVVLAMVLPPIILYAFLSRHIVEGLYLGSIKD